MVHPEMLELTAQAVIDIVFGVTNVILMFAMIRETRKSRRIKYRKLAS